MRAFCSPKPGSALSRVDQLGAGGRVAPQGRGVAAVGVAHDDGQRLDAGGHRAPVAVDGRRGGAQVGEGLGVGRGDRARVEGAEPLEHLRGAGEGPLHRELLVEQHPGEEGERVLRQDAVGRGVLGDRQRGHGLRVASSAGRRRRARSRARAAAVRRPRRSGGTTPPPTRASGAVRSSSAGLIARWRGCWPASARAAPRPAPGAASRGRVAGAWCGGSRASASCTSRSPWRCRWSIGRWWWCLRGDLGLAGPATGALAGDDLALDEELAAPDAPRLAPVEGTREASTRAGHVPQRALANSTPSGVSANHSSASFSRQGMPSPVVTDASCRSRSSVSCIGLSPPCSARPVGRSVISVRRVWREAAGPSAWWRRDRMAVLSRRSRRSQSIVRVGAGRRGARRLAGQGSVTQQARHLDYYRGAKRDPGIDEGDTTVAYVPERGWFWYSPPEERHRQCRHRGGKRLYSSPKARIPRRSSRERSSAMPGSRIISASANSRRISRDERVHLSLALLCGG